MDNIYDELFSNTYNYPTITLGTLLKFPLVIFILANLFYAYMLILKIKILTDTFESSSGNLNMKMLVYVNLIVSVIASVLGIVLILLG